MSSNAKVSLKFVFKDERAAKAVEESLRPDNIDFPEGLSMQQRLEGQELFIDFQSDGKIETLLNTIDEVLASISAVVGTIGGN